ncbi:ABC transporter substrate-binding protein [Hydrocarboniphaga effusa]|jgi:iron(III) transport system substrate-binding protein|uniref:ABC transporter substrate-binding protein n=1 Tax=Hydrocarboniphaga effusa AP103 TaxID=1172194 RepID=I8T6K8_9GAMM|nr:ABC transporter substrate-binding protein [Hydrocarboniphaga effusa]EIT69560.1 hypothetical protein WQQ_31420 [Hydrocarboniphaga effusa AP103]
MRRALVIVGLALLPQMAAADPGDVTLFSPAQGRPTTTLSLFGANDTVDVEPIVADFLQANPDLAVRYHEFTTLKLREHYLRGKDSEDGADVIMSSAMDLQVQLVNDGWAQTYVSEQTRALQTWAQWRDELFGYSYEPAVLVYNRKLMDVKKLPRTRYELLTLLRDPERPLRGRIGTYDVRRSGIGYLLASQDARLSSISGALTAALGDNQAVLLDQSRALLDRVARGEIVLAYNVLGAYAQKHIDAGAPIGIMPLADYTQVLMRTVMIPRTARRVGAARRFVDYLLSLKGQRFMAGQSPLPPLRIDTDSRDTPAGAGATERAIPLGPGLLVYLDALKRRHFLETWDAAMQHEGLPAQR